MMKDMPTFDRRAFARASMTLILALCLCLSLLSAAPVSADTQEDALNRLVGWGVMNGYPDGSLRPNNAITRAEFVALVNRAYGYRETGNMPFLDVPYTSWYYDDISIAYNARYFDGTSTTTASPQANLSREQAMTLLARGMRLDSIPGEVTEFSDGRNFSTWSRGYVKAAYQKGLIGGYSDGSFRPKQNITRGEMAILLTRALGTLVNEQGEHTLGSIYGNVTINTPGAMLYDTTIVGDLYITGGLGLGSVELDNVRVLGSIIVAGGGESEAGQDSVVLRNVRADELKIDSLAGQYLTLRAEGDTAVKQTNVRTDCYIQDRTQAGKGLLGITLEGANGNYTLAGNLETVVNKAPNSSLKIARGTLGSLTIDETATGSQLTIEGDATVKEVNLDTAVNVTGSGDVGSLNVNAEGSSTSMLPDDIYIRPGITANVYNETMDTELGQEASSAPRILAGYPKASDVAPTTLTATVATNKSGTLYWAVSSLTDGSVGEEGLLSPAAYGSKAVKYGTLQVGQSNTDINISITGLTTGGNYYFSAMLVDARDDRSPVKVISFSTPDNTVPAFASGYPALVDNTYDKESSSLKKYYADFSVKATKSCNLYWVVYTKGSTAPTAAELRSGSLAGSIARELGRKVDRNEDVDVRVTGLSELTDYDIYFWLNDFDNTKSSAVRKLSFKTVDGTPPVFVLTPTSTEPQATSLRLTTTVNENATIYWVAVTADADYPQGRPNTVSMDDLDYAIFQVENGILGSNGVKSGKVTAKANTEATINISGLKAETAYDIWYVAVDTAGNYSAFNTRKNVAGDGSPASYVRVNTRDVTAPTVTQDFTRTDSSEPPRPYPDSVISLIFSEDVQRYSYIGDETGKDYSLLSARGNSDKIRDFLLDPSKPADERVLTLHCYSVDGKDEAFTGWYNDDGSFKNDITFSARLDADGRRVIVDIKGLELNSGSWYYFELKDLADISNAQNRMREPYTIEQFQTVSSKVILDTVRDLTQLNASDIVVNEASAGNLPSPTGPIDIDMAFKFTPDATTTDNGTRDWDMIIWSNITVDFELYRRFVPAGDIGTYAEYGITQKDCAWNWLPGEGNGSVNYRLDVDTFRLGKTLFYSFVNATDHKLKNLPDDGSYFEYAIHFVSINGNSTRTAWDQDVTFTINVVAGDGVRTVISNQDEIREAYYNSRVNTSTYGVEEIAEPLQKDPPFTLNKQFIDTKAPEFATGYPTFIRSDTSLTMSVNLDRAGTIFWVATPVGSIIEAESIDRRLSGTDEDVIFRGGSESDYNGTIHKDNIIAAVNSQDTNIDPLEAGMRLLKDLDTSAITNPDNRQAKIKTGSAVIGSTGEDIEITDLDPGTGYFIYVVLRGSGSGSYSPQVKLYSVATRPSDRPVISLTSDNNARVEITTYDRNDTEMASRVSYLVMRYNDSALNDSAITGSGTAGLGDYFLNHLADATVELPEEYADDYETMTLLDSMNKFVHDGSNNNYASGTLFDIYVKQSVKDSVSNFISRNASNTTGYILGGSSADIPTTGRPPSYTIPVTCYETYHLEPGLDYIFLATATNILGTQRGFSAIYPVVKRDDSPPAIDHITATGLNITTKNGVDQLGGYLTLVFDRDLYYADPNNTSSSSKKTKQIFSGETTDGYDTSSTGDTVLLSEVVDSIIPKDNISFEYSGRLVQGQINLKLEEIASSATITFSRYLCNVYGTYHSTVSCEVSIALGKDTTGYYATITYTDGVKGARSERVDIYVPNLDLSEDSATVEQNETHALTAFVDSIPVSAAWVSDNPDVVTVGPTTGIALGKRPGRATITATAMVDGQEVSATCVVTVVARKANMTMIPDSVSIVAGNTFPLKTTITPAPATDPVVDWKSNNTAVATVDSNGVVKGEGAGTTTIIASATVEGQEVTAACTVTVIAPTAELKTAMSIPYSLVEQTTIRFEPKGFEKDMIASVVWKTTNSSIVSAASLNPDDLCYATLSLGINAGGQSSKSAAISAEITLTNGIKVKTNECLVTVTPS